MRRRPARAVAVVAGAVATALLAAGTATAEDVVVDRTIEDERVTESSGLSTSALHRDVLYTHNDSDDEPRLFAIGPDGSTEAVLTLDGAEARDWEAVSPGRAMSGEIWVGDIGDNLSSWETVRAYRVTEPKKLRDQDVEWEQYDLEYEDGPRDAETLMIHPATGRLFVVSKSAGDAAVYRAPKRLSTERVNVLRRVADAPSGVTDGEFSPDGKQYVLRGYASATFFDADEDFGTEMRRIDLPPQPQGESLTWTRDGRELLVGSEGVGSLIHRVDAWVGAGGDERGDDGDAAEQTAGAFDDGRLGLWLLAAGAAVLVVLGSGLIAWTRRED